MKYGTCKSCIFMEVCDVRIANCEDYSPVDEANDYGITNERMDEGREKFYEEWFEYVGQFDDDIFF